MRFSTIMLSDWLSLYGPLRRSFLLDVFGIPMETLGRCARWHGGRASYNYGSHRRRRRGR